jgi:hypothetical protein
MFRHLPKYLSTNTTLPLAPALVSGVPPILSPAELFKRHPAEIAAYIEAYWGKARWQSIPPAGSVGTPDHMSDDHSTLPAIAFAAPATSGATQIPLFLSQFRDPTSKAPEFLLGSDPSYPGIGTYPQKADGFLRWDHLIYAYMIENTRIYEIFRRVIHAFRHGEMPWSPLNSDSQHWLRNTEELFYNNQSPFSITNVSSFIRPDLGASRRNAYQRMFGMDLNHGMDDGKPYAYVKAEAANSTFVATFEELLREVWIGITYVTATSSANPKDDAKIASLANELHEMLQSRRKHGNLSREEFTFVSMMSWFHLTLELKDAPILVSMSVLADGIEGRLFQIAQRVGLPAHGKSRNFFDIADPMSRILIFIEQTTFTSGNAPVFYDKIAVPTNNLPADMGTIIANWTAITGRDVKARKVSAN